MKRVVLAALAAFAGSAAVYAGSSSITITPPTITSYTIGSTTYGVGSSVVNELNAELINAFSLVQSDVNANVSQFHDLTQLSEGFANANMASFDNASLLGYQTYDLFAVTVGANIGFAVPGLSSAAVKSALSDIPHSGDTYAGIGTGGIAAQAGVNAGFLVKNLYLTARAGFVPSLTYNGDSFQQGMFGLGANYTLFKQADFGFGFVKWRGLSLGSGFVFNSSTISADVALASAYSQNFSYTDTTTSTTVSGTATASNSKVNLNVTSSSFVIPIDLMTSLQVLWFVNLGLGVGADLSFSSSRITLGGSSEVNVSGLGGSFTSTPGSVKLNATDSRGNGSIFVPRLATSVGLDVGILKLDVPISYYPTTKVFAIGLTGGLVW